jgi:hypothetical protein
VAAETVVVAETAAAMVVGAAAEIVVVAAAVAAAGTRSHLVKRAAAHSWGGFLSRRNLAVTLVKSPQEADHAGDMLEDG